LSDVPHFSQVVPFDCLDYLAYKDHEYYLIYDLVSLLYPIFSGSTRLMINFCGTVILKTIGYHLLHTIGRYILHLWCNQIDAAGLQCWSISSCNLRPIDFRHGKWIPNLVFQIHIIDRIQAKTSTHDVFNTIFDGKMHLSLACLVVPMVLYIRTTV